MKKKIFFGILLFIYSAMTLCEPIVQISIPKCGTHLLFKVINLILGGRSYLSKSPFCLISQNVIVTAPLNAVYANHGFYIDANREALKGRGLKTFFICRDPRDQIVSLFYFIKGYKQFGRFVEQTFDEFFLYLITDGHELWRLFLNLHIVPDQYGLKMCEDVVSQIRGIDSFYRFFLPWGHELGIYVTSFEKLVGQEGNGTKEEQIQEIISMAEYLGKKVNNEQAIAISKNVFGNTGTFREGKIGSWKTHFTQEHKDVFKRVAGQLLIDLDYEKDFNW